MASQTLRPHRSPSPGPPPNTTPVNPSNPAKLTRQSLGPPPAATGAAKGFSGLGISSPSSGTQPRHASSSVAMGGREASSSPRPSLGPGGGRAVSSGFGGPRPSSEFLSHGMAGMNLRSEARTPEGECRGHALMLY